MTASTLDGCGTPGPAVALNPRLTRLSVTSFPTPRLPVLGCTTKKVLAVPGSAPGVTVAVARFTAHPEVNGKTNRASANLFSIVLSLPWPIDPAGAPERFPPRRTDFTPRAPFISQRPDFFQLSESTGLTGFEISFSSAPAPTVYTVRYRDAKATQVLIAPGLNMPNGVALKDLGRPVEAGKRRPFAGKGGGEDSPRAPPCDVLFVSLRPPRPRTAAGSLPLCRRSSRSRPPSHRVRA